ncbi:hypothetical protein WICPIJ_007905 [Wickerhamomyces pijperi]|uniref:Uncharacterized protein n=1 Tax=Wickerhamomyces pijperi TaxID=599730 RepID=A0A9P8Q0T1_WICPI|nr:hypothetical protein WICPIJ_007905 [Wickerhamomyces pijperi]
MSVVITVTPIIVTAAIVGSTANRTVSCQRFRVVSVLHVLTTVWIMVVVWLLLLHYLRWHELRVRTVLLDCTVARVSNKLWLKVKLLLLMLLLIQKSLETRRTVLEVL